MPISAVSVVNILLSLEPCTSRQTPLGVQPHTNDRRAFGENQQKVYLVQFYGPSHPTTKYTQVQPVITTIN